MRSMPSKRAVVDKGSDTERIEVTISEFKGVKSLDVRNYYRDKETGNYKPTPKGISVPLHLSRSLYRAIKKIGGPHFEDEPPTEKEKKKASKDRHEKSSEIVKKKKKKVDEDVPTKKPRRIEIDDEDRPEPQGKKSSGFPGRRRL